MSSGVNKADAIATAETNLFQTGIKRALEEAIRGIYRTALDTLLPDLMPSREFYDLDFIGRVKDYRSTVRRHIRDAIESDSIVSRLDEEIKKYLCAKITNEHCSQDYEGMFSIYFQNVMDSEKGPSENDRTFTVDLFGGLLNQGEGSQRDNLEHVEPHELSERLINLLSNMDEN